MSYTFFLSITGVVSLFIADCTIFSDVYGAKRLLFTQIVPTYVLLIL